MTVLRTLVRVTRPITMIVSTSMVLKCQERYLQLHHNCQALLNSFVVASYCKHSSKSVLKKASKVDLTTTGSMSSSWVQVKCKRKMALPGRTCAHWRGTGSLGQPPWQARAATGTLGTSCCRTCTTGTPWDLTKITILVFLYFYTIACLIINIAKLLVQKNWK